MRLTRSNAHVRVYLQSVGSMRIYMHARAEMQPVGNISRYKQYKQPVGNISRYISLN